MRKCKRNIISAALSAAMLFTAAVSSVTTAHAYELPNAFWSLNDSYGAAVDSKDYQGVVNYGSKVVDLISAEPDNEQTRNIIGSRAYEVAFAAYYLKDYATALKYFQIYLPYGKSEGWDDGFKIATEFVKQLTPTLDVYKSTPTEQVYYGAKNEPHGVLIGEVAETPKEHDSMILFYLEYGDTYFDWAKVIFKNADEKNQTVELALNFPQEGDTARSVSAGDSYLTQLKQLVAAYPNVPFLLRIGAEVNIWGNSCTPDEFKAAFKTIASTMRELPNVAIVWSVAHTSDWVRVSSDFYPGDEWVDWVGVTAYPTKYFTGKRWSEKSVFNEVVFKTGYSADPVLAVQEIIEEFGGRKPIMISEGGAAYYTGGEVNEEYPDWAVEQLRNMYGLIPMVYPQVKLMAYFNTRVPNEINYYDFRNCDALQNAYLNIKTSPWFIQDSGENKAQSYFEKVSGTINTGGTVTLGTYPRLFGSDSITVDYYIDGQWAQTSRQAPYLAELTVPGGNHTLKVVATGNNGAVQEKTYTITGGEAKPDENGFTDTSALNELQHSAITKAVSAGIVSGYEDSTFRPMNNITRAEFATMVCRMMGYSSDGKCTFSDAASHWASGYIKACVDAGAISGIGDNKFAPDSNVTLEQAVKIITVVCGMAKPDAAYPDGFLAAGRQNGIMENLTSDNTSGALNRIDAAMLMTQALD